MRGAGFCACGRRAVSACEDCNEPLCNLCGCGSDDPVDQYLCEPCWQINASQRGLRDDPEAEALYLDAGYAPPEFAPQPTAAERYGRAEWTA